MSAKHLQLREPVASMNEASSMYRQSGVTCSKHEQLTRARCDAVSITVHPVLVAIIKQTITRVKLRRAATYMASVARIARVFIRSVLMQFLATCGAGSIGINVLLWLL